jgi:hypothetical protein
LPSAKSPTIRRSFTLPCRKPTPTHSPTSHLPPFQTHRCGARHSTRQHASTQNPYSTATSECRSQVSCLCKQRAGESLCVRGEPAGTRSKTKRRARVSAEPGFAEMGSATTVRRTRRVTPGVRLALMAALFPLARCQDYSEPPGGCSAPVGDVQPTRPAVRKLAVPSQEDEAAEREQRVYERELEQHTRGDGEWVGLRPCPPRPLLLRATNPCRTAATAPLPLSPLLRRRLSASSCGESSCNRCCATSPRPSRCSSSAACSSPASGSCAGHSWAERRQSWKAGTERRIRLRWPGPPAPASRAPVQPTRSRSRPESQ